MTNSTFHETVYNPYKYPDQLRTVKGPTREDQENMNKYLESVHKK